MALARRYWPIAGTLFLLQYVGYALYVVFRGFPSPLSLALGIARTPDLSHLFVLGLVAGSLSFGGAYTAIPFIQAEAVVLGGWLPQQVFIDCIAIGNILPAPLVIFATFVGFQGGYIHGGIGYAFAGATVITLGMFFPCFAFTIIGHHVLEKLVHNKVCHIYPLCFTFLIFSIFSPLCAFPVPRRIFRWHLWFHSRRNRHRRSPDLRRERGQHGSHQAHNSRRCASRYRARCSCRCVVPVGTFRAVQVHTQIHFNRTRLVRCARWSVPFCLRIAWTR